MAKLILGDCIDLLQNMPDKHVNLICGSPPYAEKGKRYGSNWAMPTTAWIDWMVRVTCESVRVADNLVVWIVNSPMRKKCYLPACEGLVYECWQRGVICERPAIWNKNAPPNRRDWFGNDWEFCLAFRPANSIRYFDWQALGTPPKYSSGGRFRQRTANGQRRMGSAYPTNKLTRPRDVRRHPVGGGHLGSKLAHLNEAPFPEALIRDFVITCCPPGGTVLDPFCGSGATLAAAEKTGRSAIGFEIRQSQIDLTIQRLAEI